MKTGLLQVRRITLIYQANTQRYMLIGLHQTIINYIQVQQLTSRNGSGNIGTTTLFTKITIISYMVQLQNMGEITQSLLFLIKLICLLILIQKKKKKLILAKKQYYLDKYSPSLNISKTAGCLLGYKHTEANKLKFSSTHRGKSYKKLQIPLLVDGQ